MKDKEKKIVLIGVVLLVVVLLVSFIGYRMLSNNKDATEDNNVTNSNKKDDNNTNNGNSSSTNNGGDTNNSTNGGNSSSTNNSGDTNNSTNGGNSSSTNNGGNNIVNEEYDETDIMYDAIWSTEVLCENVTIDFSNYQGQIDETYEEGAYKISSISSGIISANEECQVTSVSPFVINGTTCTYNMEEDEVNCD